MRDAYVTRRRSLVFDGNPPPLPEDGDDDDKSAPAPAGAASQTQNGLKPALPTSGAKTSMSSEEPVTVALAPTAQEPASSPGGGVQPAPLPASAPPLPVPLPGPAPVPPPPASAPHA